MSGMGKFQKMEQKTWKFWKIIIFKAFCNLRPLEGAKPTQPPRVNCSWGLDLQNKKIIIQIHQKIRKWHQMWQKLWALQLDLGFKSHFGGLNLYFLMDFDKILRKSFHLSEASRLVGCWLLKKNSKIRKNIISYFKTTPLKTRITRYNPFDH